MFILFIELNDLFLKESGVLPISKDEKQATPTNIIYSQQSQEAIVNNGKSVESNKSIERQNSQPPATTYAATAASQTNDAIRYDSEIKINSNSNILLCCFMLF